MRGGSAGRRWKTKRCRETLLPACLPKGVLTWPTWSSAVFAKLSNVSGNDLADGNQVHRESCFPGSEHLLSESTTVFRLRTVSLLEFYFAHRIPSQE